MDEAMAPHLAATLLQAPFPPLPPEVMIPHAVVELAQSFFITVAVIALGIPIIRAFTRRFIDRPPAAPPLSAEVSTRLERIEQAVDAIAIEIERVSEAQRFQTKLMTDSRALPAASPETKATTQRDKDGLR